MRQCVSGTGKRLSPPSPLVPCSKKQQTPNTLAKNLREIKNKQQAKTEEMKHTISPHYLKPTSNLDKPTDFHLKPSSSPPQAHLNPTSSPPKAHFKPTLSPSQAQLKPISIPPQAKLKTSSSRP